MPTYNQLAATSLLNQQYSAALGLGTVNDILDTSDICDDIPGLSAHTTRCLAVFSLVYLQLIKPHHFCPFAPSTGISWHPSQKSPHGRAGCPDHANGQCCPEKGKDLNPATEQTACSPTPTLWPRWFPSSEGECTLQ